MYKYTQVYRFRILASHLFSSLFISVVLYPSVRTKGFEQGGLILLECLLAGEISESEDISWNFNGGMLSNSKKYTIALSKDVVCPYGTCDQSQLQIHQAVESDTGTYTCHYRDLSAEITVVNPSK